MPTCRKVRATSEEKGGYMSIALKETTKLNRETPKDTGNSSITAYPAERFCDNYPDILTAEEARKLLHICKGKMYTLLLDGTIPSKRLGGEWRISKKQLMAFMDGCTSDDGRCE